MQAKAVAEGCMPGARTDCHVEQLARAHDAEQAVNVVEHDRENLCLCAGRRLSAARTGHVRSEHVQRNKLEGHTCGILSIAALGGPNRTLSSGWKQGWMMPFMSCKAASYAVSYA